MKRSSEANSNVDVPSKKAGAASNLLEKSVLEQGRVYFTPIGGITVPRQPTADEGVVALGLNEIIAAIRPKSSLHLSFLLDFQFLLSSYPQSLQNTPITLVVGEKDARDLREVTSNHKNVTVIGAPLPFPYGVHHSKMSMYLSEDRRLHVIISTANITTDDWQFKTQQFYYAVGKIHDKEEDAKRSPFQSDLIEYLGQYRFLLESWRNLVRRTDFSEVADRLVFSTPGNHRGVPTERLGHPRLRLLLSEMIQPVSNQTSTERCTYIAQCSSIGSLGPTPATWFRGEFLQSIEGGNPSPKNLPAKMMVIFPSVEDIRRSCQGYSGGVSISYRNKIHRGQQWLQQWMCKWRAQNKRRTLAVPHCKSYVKFDQKMPQWQLITSANLSKAAWGELKQNGDVLFIRSYEMGVLITDPKRFNLAFDYPVYPYTSSDEPFTTDKHHMQPDNFGERWRPPPRAEF